MANNDEFSAKVREHGLRMTRQRDIILEELRKVTSHPSADEIYTIVRKRLPNISFGTVYRNLKVLKELGEILELDYGKGFSRFDGNPVNHYHFACMKCGKVFDIDSPVDVNIDIEVSRKTGFQIDYHRMEFYGTCPSCQTQNIYDIN